ncbi:MAG: hypothetical protein ACXWJC_07580 [Croceibacterium sp.]
MFARLLPLFALLLTAPAAADTLEGSWALQLGGTSIFRFDIAKDDAGKWRAIWTKPGSFASDGNRFLRVTGPPKQVRSMTALDTPDGIELSFDDPRPGAVPDIFDFKPIDENAVEMIYVGTHLAPYTLERVKPEATLGPWDPDATYEREVPPDAPPPVLATPPDERPPASPGDLKLKPGAPVGR